MSIEKRIENIEKAIKAKTGGGWALFNADGDEVNAELLQEPQQGKDGLAIYQGKQIAVELQTQDPVVMVRYHDEPPADDKLFLRKRDTEFIQVITSIPRPDDEME